jgi:glycosyltransferase involved in cell wall biosynthesis
MKISVILAVYNETKHLSTCLESLVNQNDVDSEIILVDDGSTQKIDLTPFSYYKNLIRHFRIKHQGPAKARNYGVQKSSGNILVFVDGDMVFHPNFLKILTKPIIDGKSKGTYSTEEFVANWHNVWAKCFNYENGHRTKRRIDIKRKDMIKDFRAIKKTEFLKIEGFDDTGYTDTWTLSAKLHYSPTRTKALYYHYNPDSLWEVFNHCRWVGKRQYKFGIVGKLFNLVKSTFPISLLYAYKGTKKFKEASYFPFKLVYDFGILIGIIENLTGKTAK